MIGWFDAADFEFEDWAKNNMNWDDVKDKAFLMGKAEQKIDFQDERRGITCRKYLRRL